MKRKNILIVGSGGREHAFGWKLRQSSEVGEIYFAPGNGGTLKVGVNIAIPATDISALVKFAKNSDIYLTIVGSDEELAVGIVDSFQEKGLRVFGPTKSASRIEWSKAFAKNTMETCNIPTAHFQVFSNYKEALAYIHKLGAPCVVKADGPALGKGARTCLTLKQAETALREIMLDKVHGSSGNYVIIEEFLNGYELSAHAICSGEEFIL